MNTKEFCYSFHLNNSVKDNTKVTIGDLRDLVKTLDLLALDNDVEIEECEIGIYIHTDTYPFITHERYIKP